MPSSSSARSTRTAISPRLATRTLENTAARISAGGRRLPTPGDCIGLLLVDLHRVGAAVGVGVQHAQAHAGPRRLDGVELEVAPVVRRRRGVPERRHGLGRVRLGADAAWVSVIDCLSRLNGASHACQRPLQRNLPSGVMMRSGWLSTGRISPWPGWKYVLLSRTPSLRYQTTMPLA